MRGIGECRGDNWDRGSRLVRGHSGTAGGGEDQVGMKLNQPFCEHRQALEITVGEAVNNVEVLPLDITVFLHALQKGLNENPGCFLLAPRKPCDQRSLR